jgi:polyhydroxybutyrate depolymerase
MTRALRMALVTLCVSLGACVAMVRMLRPARKPEGPLQYGELAVEGRVRSYAYYVPAKLARRPSLIIALHGTLGTGPRFRRRTAYSFDRLADRHGFVVVYPDGYERHWNDCRLAARYSARAQNVDDVGFARALVQRFVHSHGVDAARVFAVGFSNGGQLGYRLALEAPDLVRGVAALSASLPAQENLACAESKRPVSVLVMNGTDDPLNPFTGGPVSVFGFGKRGPVRSTLDTARYFVGLAGGTGPRSEALTDRAVEPWVERMSWRAPDGVQVAVVAVHGGGHVVPQSLTRYPGFLGPTADGFDGPTEVWRFFAQLLPRSD